MIAKKNKVEEKLKYVSKLNDNNSHKMLAKM